MDSTGRRDNIEIGMMQPEDRAVVVHVLGQALHFPLDYTEYWIDQVGAAQMRVARRGSRIVACLGLIPMGQWFGGRRVPMTGITAVGVALDQRGQGVGITLLRHALHEIHASGSPLATLYPSSLQFYRKVGFERAGTRLTFEAPIHALTTSERTLDVVPVQQSELDAVYQVYNQYAQATSASLDRAPFLWSRALEPRGQYTQIFLIVGDNGPEGYVVLTQHERSDPLVVNDLCILTKSAGMQVQALLAGQGTMTDRIMWHGPPGDSFAYLLTEQRAKTTRTLDWMLRLINVRDSLVTRGYPMGLTAELHLDIVDPVLPWNHGRCVLHVANGQAVVEAGGDGKLRLDVRDLAALYTGHMTPTTLARVGNLVGSESELSTAQLVFSSNRPGLRDIF